MSQAISEILDRNRNPREAFGLKAEATLHRITFSPSSVNPGDLNYACEWESHVFNSSLFFELFLLER